jgi:hypothetical protein
MKPVTCGFCGAGRLEERDLAMVCAACGAQAYNARRDGYAWVWISRATGHVYRAERGDPSGASPDAGVPPERAHVARRRL